MIRTKNPLWFPPLVLEAPNYYQYQYQHQPLTTLLSRPPSPSESSVPVPVPIPDPFRRVCLCHTRPHRQPSIPSTHKSDPYTDLRSDVIQHKATCNKVKVNKEEEEGEETQLLVFFNRPPFRFPRFSPFHLPVVKAAISDSHFKRLHTQIIALQICHQPP